MDGRIFLTVLLSMAACAGGCSQAPRRIGLPPEHGKLPAPADAPAHAVAKKAKEGPKRPPTPEYVWSLALIREEAAAKVKVEQPEQHFKVLDESRQLYQETLKLDPNYRKAQEGLVRVYTQLGEHTKAQQVLRQALAKNPKDTKFWTELGMSFNREKNFAQALVCFEKALEIDPENRKNVQAIGFTLAWMGRDQEGLVYLTRALGKAGAHYNLAGILRHQNRLDDARTHLRLALEAEPLHARAQEMLNAMQEDGVAPAPRATLGFALPE